MTLKTFFKKFGPVFSMFFTIAVVGVFHFTQLHLLKLYPVVVNFSIFLIFFSSIFSDETIIQKFARITEGELKEPVKIYTRNLTYIWCVFLFMQFLCSVATCFMSHNIWIIYNGCLSYILLGLFFAVEYFFRILFKKRNNL